MPKDKLQQIEQQATFFKTLGNSRRLLILSILSSGQLSVNEIASSAGSTLQNISQHLTLLKKNGILETERIGHTVLYKIANQERMLRILGASKEQILDERPKLNQDKEKK